MIRIQKILSNFVIQTITDLMKSFGFVHVILVLIFLLAFQCSHAQDYVLTNRGDSIPGSVKIFNTGVQKRVTVTGADKKKQHIDLLNVREFRFENDIYRPMKGPNGYSFMKMISDGYLALYGFQLEGQVNYDGLFLTKKDGTGMEVPNLNFKKGLKNYLEDCPEVVEKINEGTYGKKDLNTIISEYNSCIQGKSVNHSKIIAENQEIKKKSGPWETLSEKLSAHPDFEGKSDAIDMIGEIKGKISRMEKVPNFMIEGLRNSLKPSNLQAELENALLELKK